MTDETQQFSPPAKPAAPTHDSKIFNVSLRGLIALIVIVTICAMSLAMKDIKEPLYTLGGLIVGFYFGQNQKPTLPSKP